LRGADLEKSMIHHPATEARAPQCPHFALATCNGCHAGETATDFVHINLRRRGEQSMMAEYLTGETILDPGGVTRTFNELSRRADFLRDLLQGPWKK
jgi:hypothetical protein